MIRYAGVETLLPSPEVEAFVNANLPAGLARYFYEPGGGPELLGTAPTVPRSTWDATFRPEVNCLYWPTGASRWSVMLLLVDSDMLDDIVPLTSAPASTHFEAAGQQLVLADTGFSGTIADDDWSKSTSETLVALSTEMFALTPHPLSDYDGATKTLWILPLVDQRWFWQWKNIGTGPTETDTETWEDYFDFFGTKLGGFTINNATVPSIYGDPDALSDLKYANAATTVDAVARSVGQRVVRLITGEVRTYSPTTATTRWNANTVDPDDPTVYSVWKQLAGGSFSYKAAATMPQTIRVIDGATTNVVDSEDAGATAWKVGAEATIFTKYPAGADEADFATQVATDWVGWRAGKKSDVAYVGVKAWANTGFEDFVAYSHGALGQSPSTRIVTFPENLDVRPVSKSSSGAPRIRFQILSASFSIGLGVQGCDHVTAIVTHVSCGGAGVSVGDEVDIYDPEYCHFNLPVELLVGLSGSADYMDASSYLAGQEYLVDCVPEVQALGCIWMVDKLCCAEEETLYAEA